MGETPSRSGAWAEPTYSRSAALGQTSFRAPGRRCRLMLAIFVLHVVVLGMAGATDLLGLRDSNPRKTSILCCIHEYRRRESWLPVLI